MGDILPARFVGVDPGQDGSVAVLAPDGHGTEAVWAWTHFPKRKVPVYEVRQQLPELGVSELEVRFLHELVMASILPTLRQMGPYHLVVEELFVWEGHDCGFDTLAEVTGEVLGPLRASALSSHRVLARNWRPVVLPRGWGRKSAEAERAAHKVCRANSAGLEAWLEQVEIVEKEERTGWERKVLHPRWPHVLEARLLARWGWLQLHPRQPALLGPARKRRASR